MSSLDKHILKELLLVCSALGSIETSDQDAENEGFQRFVRGENCLEWLQDLQRYLNPDVYLYLRNFGADILLHNYSL